MSALGAARATFRAERSSDMAPSERVDLAFRSVRLSSEARSEHAFRVLTDCRAAYGEAFERAMRERAWYGDRQPESLAFGADLLRAARRYRWVTRVLMGLQAAHRITAWSYVVWGCGTRADSPQGAA